MKNTTELLIEYKQLKTNIDGLTEKLNKVKKQLQEAAGTEKLQGEGVTVNVFEVWEKKQTPAQYIKENNIKLDVIDLDEPMYQYRITVEKEK